MIRAEHRLASRRARWSGVVAAVLALTVGCTGSSGGGGGAGGSGDGADAAPAVTVQPAGNATGVAPGTPVVVTASRGTLTTVTVRDAAGAQIAGRLDDGKTTWTSTGKLALVTAKAQVFPAVSPLRDTTVGVGMPIRVYFNAPVTDRKAALDHMKVLTSVP